MPQMDNRDEVSIVLFHHPPVPPPPHPQLLPDLTPELKRPAPSGGVRPTAPAWGAHRERLLSFVPGQERPPKQQPDHRAQCRQEEPPKRGFINSRSCFFVSYYFA